MSRSAGMEESVMITRKEVATLLDIEELPRQSWWTRGHARLHLKMCRLLSGREVERARIAV